MCHSDSGFLFSGWGGWRVGYGVGFGSCFVGIPSLVPEFHIILACGLTN